jgi:hypothetical protein
MLSRADAIGAQRDASELEGRRVAALRNGRQHLARLTVRAGPGASLLGGLWRAGAAGE